MSFFDRWSWWEKWSRVWQVIGWSAALEHDGVPRPTAIALGGVIARVEKLETNSGLGGLLF